MSNKLQQNYSYIQLSQDSPLSDINDDRFEREKLARDIANSIINMSKTNHDCTNIAIYGKWGEGKTTLMNFVESILLNNGKKDRIYIAHFNPWMAGNEENLIRDFFKSISFDIKNEINLFFQRYGKAISFGVHHGVDAVIPRLSKLEEKLKLESPGEKAAKIIDQIKDIFAEDSVPLYVRKNDLCKIIKEKEIHLLVFIDDIDRLDKEEVHAVFRLIRQVADFPNTIYMISMDPEVVAKSLGQYYGNNIHDGWSFIEKIVQVPIFLPKISHQTIQNDVENMLMSTLAKYGEKQDEIAETISYISELITTPRQLIRFKNQIGFKINALAGEINLCDVCMLEAINIMSPETYNNIYVNWKKLFRRTDLINSVVNKEQEAEAVKARFEEAINEIINKVPDHQKNTCKEIINYLFPSQTYSGYKIIANKKVQSTIFFFRYFNQGTLDGDLSEKEIDVFGKNIDTKSESDLISCINEIVNQYDYDNLNRAIQVTLFRTRDISVKSERIHRICLALCQSEICNTTTETFAREGLFTPGLILNILNTYMPSMQEDGNVDYHTKETSLLLKRIYEKSEINFSMALFRLVNGHLNFYSSLDPDHIAPLVESFVKLPYSEQYNYQTNEIRELFEEWKKYDKNGPKDYLIKALGNDNFDSTKLLVKYINGGLNAVDNQRSMSEMVYIFGESIELLVDNLKHKELEGTTQKALDYLSYNWRDCLKA